MHSVRRFTSSTPSGGAVAGRRERPTHSYARRALLLAALLLTSGCASFLPSKLPKDPPPLAQMVEPLPLFAEPKDEAQREALPPGSFSGLEVGSALTSRDQTETPPGILVTKVVENSPADAAGLRRNDLLESVTGPGGKRAKLSWPSEWRKIEISSPPGTKLVVTYDRAGAARTATITLIPRVHPRNRRKAVRYRETKRVGVVVRTATEVEARKNGLGPGGGAVIVGLSLDSPWRQAGLRFGDLITKVDGKPVDHPQVLLDAIRNDKKTIELTFVRKGRVRSVVAALSRRETNITRFNVPVLFDYERDRDESDLSILLGLIRYRTTPAASAWRIFFLIHFASGDADRLQKVAH